VPSNAVASDRGTLACGFCSLMGWDARDGAAVTVLRWAGAGLLVGLARCPSVARIGIESVLFWVALAHPTPTKIQLNHWRFGVQHHGVFGMMNPSTNQPTSSSLATIAEIPR
jgi:hypothetical protein